MTIERARRAELDGALDAHGWTASSIEVLSPPAPKKFNRALYHAVVDDGMVVKLRVLEGAAAAAELVARRSEVGPAFAPVLGLCGPVIVEAWVDGTLLTDMEPTPLLAGVAGAVLGELHQRPVGPRTTSAALLDTARADLAALRSADCVTAAEANEIELLLSKGDPGTYVPCLIHRDFSAENFVVDGQGALRVIDNEWFCSGPAGFDVGRTRNRWPMSEAERSAFDAGYEGIAGPIVDEVFWGLAADLFGARVEDIWVRGPERPILERVRSRAAGGRP